MEYKLVKSVVIEKLPWERLGTQVRLQKKFGGELDERRDTVTHITNKSSPSDSHSLCAFVDSVCLCDEETRD